MPLVLQQQIKPAVRTARAKNQTVFLTTAIATLLKQIHDGVVVKDLMVDQCSLGQPSSMINIRIAPMILDIVNGTSPRFYQATTRTVIWATALAIQRQGLNLDIAYAPELPARISIPREVATLMGTTTTKLDLEPDLYLQYATTLLVQAIHKNRPMAYLGLPKGVWPKTSRNVPTHNPQYHKLSLDPETADEVSTLAPRLYHSPSTFVLWAACWVGFNVAKMS